MEVCSLCNCINHLEKCFECNTLICESCSRYHYDQWKTKSNRESAGIDLHLNCYKEEINKMDLTFTNNSKNIEIAEAEIERTYNNMIRLLNIEKSKLMAVIKDLKNQNTNYTNFSHKIEAVRENLRIFRETNQLKNLSEMKTIQSKYEMDKKIADECAKEYQNLSTTQIKFLEKFEKKEPPLAGLETYLGKLHLKDAIFDNKINPIEPKRDFAIPAGTAPPNNELFVRAFVPPIEKNSKIFPELSSKLNSINQTNLPKTNKDFLLKWKTKATHKPTEELIMDKEFVPNFLSKFRNYLFCMNESGNIYIFVITTKNTIEYKNFSKIDVPKIKSIAVNTSYFGLTFSKLEAKEMKRLKNVKSSGVLLFKRENDIIRTTEMKEINISEGLRSPVGLALNENYAFVCDQELRRIFKIEIQSNTIANTINLSDGEPYGCSINKDYLLITDTLKHRLCLFNIESFKNIHNLQVKQDDNLNGPFDCYLGENNLVLYKNYKESQLVVTDTDFEVNEQYCFEKIKSLTSFSFFDDSSNQVLIYGLAVSKKSFKLVTYY